MQLLVKTKIHTSADQLLASGLSLFCVYDAQSACCHLFWSCQILAMIKSRKDRSVITDCSKNAFHIDHWLVFLAHLLRDILTAKFQSEQSLPTTPEKFWINYLPNLLSLYSSFPSSSPQCRHDSAPRITWLCSTQPIPCYCKGFRHFSLTYPRNVAHG